MRRIVTVLLLSLSLVVAGAACSGSSNNSSSKATEKPKQGASSSTAKLASTTAKPASSNADAKFSGGGGSAYCKLAQQVSQGAQLTPSATPAGLLKQLETANEMLAAATKVVPSEIRPDFVIVADATGKFIKAMKDTGGDYSKLDPSAAAAFRSPQFAAAAARLQKYNQEVCGVTVTATTLPKLGG